MLGQIGTARPAGDIVDLLLECHVRIRRFTDIAVRLGETRAAPAPEVAEAAAAVHRYFSEALPLHARDEEESLLPRLAGKDSDVDRALVEMHRQHDSHGPILERVVRLCATLAATPTRHGELAAELAEAARELRAHFDGHLAPEEETIFPAIRRLLPEDERGAMLRELRARRGGAGDHSSR
jgi:iron-sulfur cluster repair protein YtfE (RIC family)